MKKIKVKPGKTQSFVGFCVGIIFCIIGLVVVIPSAGIFGIVWTAIAVIITISNALNAFGEKGIPTYEVDIEDSHNVEDRLKTLDSLYNQGLINKEEYDKKRKDILKDI